MAGLGIGKLQFFIQKYFIYFSCKFFLHFWSSKLWIQNTYPNYVLFPMQFLTCRLIKYKRKRELLSTARPTGYLYQRDKKPVLRIRIGPNKEPDPNWSRYESRSGSRLCRHTVRTYNSYLHVFPLFQSIISASFKKVPVGRQHIPTFKGLQGMNWYSALFF